MKSTGGTGRINQKTRTRVAIVDACRQLIKTGADVTMPEVAKLALVSDATMYRYFPDLASLVNEALSGLWPSPAEALAPIADIADPVKRIAFTAEEFLRRVLAYQGSVRAMISATITRSATHATRPRLRFDWIEYALAPMQNGRAHPDTQTLAQLKQDLAVIISAEALFTLTDLCGLRPNEAIASAVRMATTITAATIPVERVAHPEPA